MDHKIDISQKILAQAEEATRKQNGEQNPSSAHVSEAMASHWPNHFRSVKNAIALRVKQENEKLPPAHHMTHVEIGIAQGCIKLGCVFRR